MITWVRFAPCTHSGIASFSTRFRRRENVSIRNRVRVKTLRSLGMHTSFKELKSSTFTDTVRPRLSRRVGTGLNGPDNRENGGAFHWTGKTGENFPPNGTVHQEKREKRNTSKGTAFFPKTFHRDEPFHLNSPRNY